jgi:hypothetical protein
MSQTIKTTSIQMSTVTFEALSARIAILEGIVKEKLGEKKQETSRVKKDGTERKKRAVSAYQLFCNENRLDVRAELNANIAEGQKMARGAVLSELATRWKQLDEDEKKEWNDKKKELESSSDEEKPEVEEKVEEEEKPEVEDKVEEEEKPEVEEKVEEKKKPKEKKEKKEKKKKPVEDE